MRIAGTLTKWNDDRGFGFITPAQGGPEVFVHISAFPKDGHRPTPGERLTFEIEIASDGKKRARNLLCPGRTRVRPARQAAARGPGAKQGMFRRFVPLAVVVAVAIFAYGEYSRRVVAQSEVGSQPDDQGTSSSFHCDHRTRCSQMTSCAEATYFVRNCPKVEMDGDHDGVPCEQQWCTDPLGR